jgi:hypothetical protein
MKYFIVFISILFLVTAASAQQQQIDTIPAQQGWVHLTSGTTAYLPLLCLKGKDTVYAEGGIITLRSTDAGATWDSATNLPGPGYLTIGDDGTEYFSGPADTIFVSMDEGAHWQPHYTGLPFAGAEIKTKGTYCWLRYGSNIAYSSDRGVMWGGGSSVASGWNIRALAFADTLHGYLGGDNFAWYHGRPDAPYFARTSNSGADWDTVYPAGLKNSEPKLSTIVGLIALSKDTLFAVGEAVAKSEDGGNNWTTFPNTSGPPLDDYYSISFPDRIHGTVVGGLGWILHTEDGGQTWVRQNSGTTNGLHSVAFIDSVAGYASGENGTILKTTNGGLSWVRLYPGQGSLQSSVYPLPADREARIDYSLAEAQHVSLTISDLTGAFVSEILTQALQQPGIQSVAINTSQFPSGTYIYHLASEKYSASGKLQVIH